MEPIFIIGTERSGTNLLRVILDSHSNISIPHPPHIVKNFFRLEPLYDNLRKDDNFRRLIHDVVKMVELHPYPWEIKINENRIFDNVNNRDLINVFFQIYTQYLTDSGKKRWGCKSTFMINHVALIRKYFPHAKFIYMVRDGRDVAVSAKKSIFNHFSVYFIAKLWKKEQDTGIYWLKELSKEEICLIKYEDLLISPQEVVKSICSFLDEPYEEKMIGFFKTKEAEKSSRISDSWKNTSSPIMKDNFGKFKTQLRPGDIDLFERIAGYELNYFSYLLMNSSYASEGQSQRMVKFKIIYLLEEIILMLKIQARYFLSDKNNFLRYKKFWFLKWIKFREKIRCRQ